MQRECATDEPSHRSLTVQCARISAKCVCVWDMRRTSSSSARRPHSTHHSGCSICFLFDGLLARKFVLHAHKRFAGLSHVISQHIFIAFFFSSFRYHFADPKRVKSEIRKKKKMNVKNNYRRSDNTSRSVRKSGRIAISQPSDAYSIFFLDIFSTLLLHLV